ncbi:MAG TPA: calcium-binding protein [Cycloclasticus sp.]|jgi:Ca2+-binding RTX toxin-like protein|nr:calcium-binding protein [Cycloclasticus sp.]
MATGAEFQVNTYTAYDQGDPSIAALADGGFVVTWQSGAQYAGVDDRVYAQIYDANGSTVGTEFQVNTYTTNYQVAPSIAALADGGFVVTWQSDGQDGSGNGIYAQRYDANGSVNGTEFQVHTYTSTHFGNQSITALSDGGFVITWDSYGQDGDGYGIYAQRYSSDGNLVVAVDDVNEVLGTASDDILNGTAGVDNISTLEGADVVLALAGNDIITLTADAVWGSGYGAQNVSNGSSVGTNEIVSIEGLNRFTDVIDAGADIDVLTLTDGSDAFFIDDVYSAHHSSLTLSSTTQGVDSTARLVDIEIINAGDGNDIVDLTSDNFVLTNAVTINGEAGNDILWGSNGDDAINGGVGDDSIFGGAGNDILTGGAGNDVFQFTATSGQSDIITDFSLTDDTIELFYREGDDHAMSDLSLNNGILTWDVLIDDVDNVVIDLSATTTSSDLADLSPLITFVEIA